MNFPGHSHFFKTQLPEHNKMALAADICMDNSLVQHSKTSNSCSRLRLAYTWLVILY